MRSTRRDESVREVQQFLFPRPHSALIVRLRVVIADQVQNAVDEQMLDLIPGGTPGAPRLPKRRFERDDDFPEAKRLIGQGEVIALSQRKGKHVGSRVVSRIAPIEVAQTLIIGDHYPELDVDQALGTQHLYGQASQQRPLDTPAKGRLDG